MTHFTGGPANGQTLTLNRAPVFLRVTESAGKWDALDQFDDTPRPNERIFVYQLTGQAGTCFMDGRDAQGRRWGRSCVMATYRFIENQPDDATMRDTTAWRDWCQARGKAEGLVK